MLAHTIVWVAVRGGIIAKTCISLPNSSPRQTEDDKVPLVAQPLGLVAAAGIPAVCGLLGSTGSGFWSLKLCLSGPHPSAVITHGQGLCLPGLIQRG